MNEEMFYNTDNNVDGFMPLLRFLNEQGKAGNWAELDRLLETLFIPKMSDTNLTGFVRFLYNDRHKLKNYYGYVDRMSVELEARGKDFEAILKGIRE